MDEDDSYKYYPFPNISLEENRGKRYPVPQLPKNSHLAGMDAKRGKKK